MQDTQSLVDSYVRTYGQRGASRKLTERGYRSPEGKPIQQGHITRIQAGSYTQLLAPETPIEPISAPAPSPIAARPPIPEKTPAHYLERGPAPASPSEKTTIDPKPGPLEVRRRLRQELEDQETSRKEREENSPPEVPRTSDYSSREHSHPERYAKVSAIFSRRGEVQLDPDDKDFFGIPRLARQPQKTVTKPHETKSYAKLSMNAMEPYRLQSKKS